MNTKQITLQLLVNNHPGVMMHIVSLFARRAFNLDGIVCFPFHDGSRSCMWLKVQDDHKLDQIILQLSKLVDVIEVKCCSVDSHIVREMELYWSE